VPSAVHALAMNASKIRIPGVKLVTVAKPENMISSMTHNRVASVHLNCAHSLPAAIPAAIVPVLSVME
jgi:hypothetical protein